MFCKKKTNKMSSRADPTALAGSQVATRVHVTDGLRPQLGAQITAALFVSHRDEVGYKQGFTATLTASLRHSLLHTTK